MHIQAYFSIFTLIMPSKANQFNKYSDCCGRATRERFLSLTESPDLSQLQSSSYASKNPGEAPCQSRISGRSHRGASSSCLFSSCNLDNRDWQYAPRPATLKTRCIRRYIRLFMVESTHWQGWLRSVQICQ